MYTIPGTSHGNTVDDCIVRCGLETVYDLCYLAPHARNDVFWTRKRRQTKKKEDPTLYFLGARKLTDPFTPKLKVISLDDKYLAHITNYKE